MNEILIEKILTLSDQLPTGINDPDSLNKLNREQQELYEALEQGDEIGAILEASDCAYYAVKSEWNGFLTKEQRDAIISSVANDVNLPTYILLDCVIAKYTFRVQKHMKDDEIEREIVAQQIDKFKK